MNQPVTHDTPVIGIVCGEDDEGDDWRVAARYFGARLAHLRFPIVPNVAVEPPTNQLRRPVGPTRGLTGGLPDQLPPGCTGSPPPKLPH